MCFNNSNEQQGLADGLKLLVQAYRLDPTNTSVLCLLGHVCLLKRKYSAFGRLQMNFNGVLFVQLYKSLDMSTEASSCTIFRLTLCTLLLWSHITVLLLPLSLSRTPVFHATNSWLLVSHAAFPLVIGR